MFVCLLNIAHIHCGRVFMKVHVIVKGQPILLDEYKYSSWLSI